MIPNKKKEDLKCILKEASNSMLDVFFTIICFLLIRDSYALSPVSRNQTVNMAACQGGRYDY